MSSSHELDSSFIASAASVELESTTTSQSRKWRAAVWKHCREPTEKENQANLYCTYYTDSTRSWKPIWIPQLLRKPWLLSLSYGICPILLLNGQSSIPFAKCSIELSRAKLRLLIQELLAQSKKLGSGTRIPYDKFSRLHSHLFISLLISRPLQIDCFYLQSVAILLHIMESNKRPFSL
jgi:hypothetical protein